MVLAFVVEPTRAYRDVHLAWQPSIAILIPILILSLLSAFGLYHRPVGFSSPPRLVANPADGVFCTTKYHSIRKSIVDCLCSTFVLIIFHRVDFAMLSCAAIVAIATICTIEPKFE